jgi:citrate lyase subunit beta/citryl-CoA lyase
LHPPRQAAAANAVFGVSEEACAEAVAILAAWNEAQAQGLSVASLGGRMIDLPVAERARRRLARR